MGNDIKIWCALWLVVCASGASAIPHADYDTFLRSAVETVPRHEPIGPPIRASVESIPLRSLRDEGDERLPLRDAVEKRPISLMDKDSFYKYVDDAETINSEDVGGYKLYYGAANHMNKNDERLQQGNANLQEMQQTSSDPIERKLVVCYMESWAAYRAPPLAFTSGLVPKSCTHLHYAFAAIDPHTYQLIPANEDYDVIKGGYRIATGLKRRIHGLRVIISVGGEGTERLFSELIQSSAYRSRFIDSAINFLQEHDFDGIDLHWVYPGERDEKEKELLTKLLYELREKFAVYGYTLSTVLPPFRYQIEDGYDLSAVSGAVDYVILQAWDMTHGKRDEPPPRAVQHSALHMDPGAASRDQRYDNIEFMVKYILRRGMSADKLVLGVPLYGRSYTIEPNIVPSPGAIVSSWGDEGPYTQTKGLMSYFEICIAEKEGKGISGTDEAGNSFAVFDNQWVSYDTPSSILEKMKFVISSGLAGAAAWAIDMDDFRGLCGSPFPLLNAISTTLNGAPLSSDQSTLKIGSCDADMPYLASDEDSCAHFHFCTGGIGYRMVCEDDRLYDPSTGFCGHQDVSKCLPGQSLRISVEEAARFLSQAYEMDFELSHDTTKEVLDMEREKLIAPHYSVVKQSKDNGKRVLCYMTSWAFYRRGDGKFVPENIDTRLCTHVVYAYASLSTDELIAKDFDPWTDLTNNLYDRVTSLQDVKVLLGLGGWTDSAGDKYSRLVSSSTSRAKFIENLIPFLKLHGFKGLHLDWNYPVCWQSNCKKGAVSDKANFAKLVQELSNALHGVGMELGIAVSGYKEVIETAYDLPTLSRATDFLSTMTYDYHGGWERVTAHHTPLTSSPQDSIPYYSIEYAIKALISGGADPKKLNLGLSFYGQSYRLADIEGPRGIGAAAAGPGEPGEFTKQPGMLAFYEICYRIKNLRWKTGRQEKAGPYAYLDNQWVGYDDPKSIAEKVEWALKLGLGGVTAWAIDLDDFNNRCCNEPSPLLRAANRALGRNIPAPGSACERPPEPITPSPPTTTTVASDGSIGGGEPGGDHGGHDHHTSTTWPNWTPAVTTPSSTQTWWQPATTSTTTPAATTTPTTTTRRPTTTSTTTTTTTRRPVTAAPVRPPPDTDGLEGALCEAGTYHSDPNDCEGYLQCEGGHWRKHQCAPGLHWSNKAGRCDWPSNAKCSVSSNEASTATSTLAPISSRPPPRPSSTTTRMTTSTTTTTTTTTTTKPTTTPSLAAGSGGAKEGQPCNGQDYTPVAGDCNAYLHCDGNMWRLQHCAPGLHWSAKDKNCDWPKYTKCDSKPAQVSTTATTSRYPRPTRPTSTNSAPSNKPSEDSECSWTESHAPASSCDAYLLCVGGRWRKQACSPGLHWDQRNKRCDWPDFAMCDANKPSTTKMPQKPATSLRPTMYTTTQKPVIAPKCTTGTYHAHPKCEKFYVCVNGNLVTQSCAPGLVWAAERAQCDFPKANSCTDRRRVTSAMSDDSKPMSMQIVEEPNYCESGQYDRMPGDCTRYRHCLFGKFEEFACSAGLHWNKDKQICDWPKNANCKSSKEPTTTSTNKPAFIAPAKPEQANNHEVHPVITKPDKFPSLEIISDASKPLLLTSRYKLVCYYTNWSWYRPGIGKYSPEDIDPSLCTHIVYGFAVLGKDGLIEAHDTWSDYDNRFYERVVEFKKYGIKVSLALGGWNDSAGDKYSKLVNDASARARFIAHVIQFVEKFGFDGLDLDWEYPKCWQVDCSKGPDSDKDSFADLVRELSAVFKPKGLLLSSAVSPSKKVIDAGYDVPILARYLDWIAVMTYDYHGQWDMKTGHVAPLYYHPDDDNTYFNANYTMHYWIKKGAPPSKLIMGMPMYGQTFTITNDYDKSNNYGLNTPALTGGEEGEYTRAKGFLSYYEICERIKHRDWKVVKDPYQRMGPYAFKGDQWVSFDDTEIIKKKVAFIKSLNLGGGMVWALDLDDFRNRCGEGKHPLINAITNGLLGSNSEIDSIESNPILEPINEIDEDLDDIQVRPISKPATTPRPMKETTHLSPIIHTTKKPVIVSTFVEEKYKVVCYYTNWAWYRPGPGKYTPNEIDPSLCTHIVYAFAVLDTARLVIKPHDTWLDVENKFYEKVIALKSRGVRVVLGLGGWNDSAGDKYSRLVNNAAARRKFIVHALDFIEQYGFDGLDLDWEYPKCWQVNCEKGPDSDKQGFSSLVQELRAAFVPRGLLLSAAVSASKKVIDAGYDIPTLSKNLDWIALMTYDYHGQWEKKTGHVAPMYASENDEDKTLNANFTVNYWISKGAPREKLIMGMPFYGQSFSLMENAGTGLGAPSYAGGEAGDETRARGFLSFYEICERVKAQGWKVVRDVGGRMGPYAYLSDQWVSFDDDFMIRHKAEYVRAMGLGGSMVWALDLDDFNGQHCGCGISPLLKNINHVLRDREAPPPCSLHELQALSTETESGTPEESSISEPKPEPEMESEPSIPESHYGTMHSSSSLAGKQCSGTVFKADNSDCSKYYLCINGVYMELACPAPLVWNKNHCDWPEKSQCKIRAALKLIREGSEEEANEKPIIACYFTNWAFYRQGVGSYGPEQIDPTHCTHIVYSWAHVDRNTYEIVPGNAELDIDNDFYGKVTELRTNGIKVILGVGGLEDSEDNKWSRLASNAESRKAFVDSALRILQRWNFDGIQIAWQYPVCKQAPCATHSPDKENFSALVTELSRLLRSNDYDVSAMVASSSEIAELAYNPVILIEELNWIAISANDYYASSTGTTGYLVPFDEDQNIKDGRSFNSTISFWAQTMVPPHMLVLTIPAYGRTYTLRSSSTTPGAAVIGPGEPGPYTKVPGLLAYYEICGELGKSWAETRDALGTYASKGNQWASYLRPEEAFSVGATAGRRGLRGVGLWALDLDDWQGSCGVAHPLLSALRQGMTDPNVQQL